MKKQALFFFFLRLTASNLLHLLYLVEIQIRKLIVKISNATTFKLEKQV